MEETESRIINLERLCRLCLHEKHILMDIFESSDDNYNLNIEQKIKACAAIDLCKNDGLPTRICIPCLSSLNAAFDFRIQCENSDKTLHEMYQLLVYDQVKKGNTSERIIDRNSSQMEYNEPQDIQFSDLNHIIVIKDSENIDEDKETEAQETGDFLYVLSSVKKNEESSENLTVDGLMKVEEEDGIASSDSFEVLPEETKKSILMSFPVDGKDTSEIILNPLGENKKNSEKLLEKTKSRVHDDAKKSACPFCHKMLTRVNEHIRLLHQNKVYICKKHNCGAEFLTLKNLQSHQLKCYNMEKPYKCLRCYKEFYRKCNYKSHIIRHSNKKDFQCQLCDKAFVDSTGLKRHFLKHHEVQQEIFISSCCGKKFKTKEGLKQHIQKGICGIQVFEILHSTDEII